MAWRWVRPETMNFRENAPATEETLVITSGHHDLAAGGGGARCTDSDAIAT